MIRRKIGNIFGDSYIVIICIISGRPAFPYGQGSILYERVVKEMSKKRLIITVMSCESEELNIFISC